MTRSLFLKRQKIHVSETFICHGYVGSCRHCPIAIAIKEKFPEYDVHVLYNMVNFYTKAGLFVGRMLLPRSAQRFIRRFDKSKLCKPFTFYLMPEA